MTVATTAFRSHSSAQPKAHARWRPADRFLQRQNRNTFDVHVPSSARRHRTFVNKCRRGLGARSSTRTLLSAKPRAFEQTDIIEPEHVAPGSPWQKSLPILRQLPLAPLRSAWFQKLAQARIDSKLQTKPVESRRGSIQRTREASSSTFAFLAGEVLKEFRRRRDPSCSQGR